jgi:broad specificity phosphatase PhoE
MAVRQPITENTEETTRPMKRILLIRHGQTDWNVEGRWQGHAQIPLNQRGIEQAQALAEHLREREISVIYSSDLIRALKTAEMIAEGRALTVRVDPRWRELNLGLFQGMTTAEINGKYPDEAQQMRADYMDFVIPQGESRRMMMERVYPAYQDLLVSDNRDQEIAVVSHGGTIRVLLLKLFNFDEVFQHQSLHNTSISTLETDGETVRLLEWAATPHLID